MSEQDNKVNVIKDHLAKLESEGGQYENRVKDFQQDIKKQTSSVSRNIDQGKTDILSQIANLATTVSDLTDNLKGLKTDIESEKGDFGSRLEKLLDQLQKGTVTLQKQLNSLTKKQEEDISQIYGEMAGKVNTGLDDIYSHQYKQIKEFQDQISNKLADVQKEFVSTVERENANIGEMSDSVASSFLQALDEFNNRVTQISDAKENELDNVFANTLRQSVSRLEIAKEDLLAGIDGLKARLDDNLIRQKELLNESQQRVIEIIKEEREGVKTKIEKGVDGYYSEWQKYQEEQKQTISNIKENVFESFISALKTNEELQSKVTTEFENSLKSGFRQLEEQILSSLSRVSSDFSKKRLRTSETLTKAFENWYANINSSFEQFGVKTKSKLEDTTSDLNGSLMGFFKKSQDGMKDVLIKHETTLGDLQEGISQQFKEIQTSQEKNIEITLTDVRRTLQSKQSELLTTVSSIAPTADTVVETNREVIKTKNSEIKRSSTAAFDDLRKQIRTIEQDGLVAIQNIVSITNDKLDQAVKDSEESTTVLVGSLEDEHKNSLIQFRSDTSQKITDHQDTLDKYSSSLQERFAEFFTEVQNTSDNFIGKTHDQREYIDDQRRKIDVQFEEVQSSIDSSVDNFKNNVTTNSDNITSSVKQITTTTKEIIKDLR
ncbi:hypothetical protein CEE45_11735 [Candidatus Heimdallarchaeota archaeon B3_Heim]|nr:MAG: hypothetical protein CEE45_11735 [Candidatus Heimdallarchaeota archaeon B3_Heim]